MPGGLQLSSVQSGDSGRTEPTEAATTGGHLEVADVGLRSGPEMLFEHISFSADPGSTTFIVGADSNVQSALLAVLLGTESPSVGTVSIDGDDVGSLSLAALRSTTAIALRDPWLTAGTIADNIARGLGPTDQPAISEAAQLAGVEEFTRRWKLGIYTEISERAPELTLGQRRLVALARAIVRRPRVLLIEEPTSTLPAAEERLVIKAINRVTERVTTVLTTDRLTLAGARDQVIRIDRGQPEATAPRPTGGPTPPSTDPERRPVPKRLGTARSVRAKSVAERLAPKLASTTLLEQGATTETWLAWALDRDHLAQVKLARRSPANISTRLQLAREYQRIVSLRHSGLARPIEARLDGPDPYTVYEHVEAPTLAAVIGSHAQLPHPTTVLRMGYELARTLCSLHHHGLVHLDLRPQITVLSPQGTILTDLGLAQPIGERPRQVFRPGQVGTLAPEQLRGDPAVPSMDIYALGVLMYQALTGATTTTYRASFRDRNQILAPRPPARRPVANKVRLEAMRWHPAGSARATSTRHDTRATWTVARDLSQAVRATIDQMTAADPHDRPTADQAMALMRPFLFPAPARNAEAGDGTGGALPE